MIIRRKVRLKHNQIWSDKILKYLDSKPYGDWRVAIYEAGLWESENLMEAQMGHINPGENPSYIYEHEVMSDEEYNEWTTTSGVE